MDPYVYSFRFCCDPDFNDQRELESLDRFVEEAAVDDVAVFCNVEEINTGHMTAAEQERYLKLLEEAVLTEQGQPAPQRTECAADLSIAASIPDRYVPAPEQRMDLYRRIAAIRSEEDADDLVDELIDRYGEPPRTVNNLISVALLRAAAAQAEITDISQKNGQLVFTLGRFSLEQFSGLCGMEKYKNRLLLTPGDVPRFTFRLRKGEDPLRLAQALVADYGEAGAAP